MRKSKLQSDRKKLRDNVTFLHTENTIIQLHNVVFSEAPYYREMSAQIVETDSIYSDVYKHIEKKEKGRVPKLLFPKNNDKYVKQTHIYVDSLKYSNGSVTIQEDHVRETNLYFVKKNPIIYIIISSGVAVNAFLIWVHYKIASTAKPMFNILGG